ncbi:hypothetical protein Dsin_013264 [Dipteronia sinensis]|uniref:Protein FAR1-RELATED SEQUENCE n=1 Tax=Dipteronia sinensis TaxID=43782 RepID=A0AAE0E8Y8_9ROSI|nr:hypothetical protein Dsin_013264 [Dipteronia sinensis]
MDGYNMIFATFLGLNHRGKCLLFGGALLLDSSIASFVWLLRTFMDFMGRRQPKTIFTYVGATGDTASSRCLSREEQEEDFRGNETAPAIILRSSAILKQASKCILKRWTKSAKDSVVVVEDVQESEGEVADESMTQHEAYALVQD